ncbi:MAG: hypothetical protein MJ158_04005 [Alphaproteobacteria bacterium]|nr:hypothetical protein [Alphaproteobacteria bacterium]
MKKIIVFSVISLFPVIAFSAPSVRILGGSQGAISENAAKHFNNSIGPIYKNTLTRNASVRSATKTSTGSIVNVETARLAGAKFPIVKFGTSSGGGANVPGRHDEPNCTDCLQAVDDLREEIKADIYDDPRFDAIPTSQHVGRAPDGYYYMWVEP